MGKYSPSLSQTVDHQNASWKNLRNSKQIQSCSSKKYGERFDKGTSWPFYDVRRPCFPIILNRNPNMERFEVAKLTCFHRYRPNCQLIGNHFPNQKHETVPRSHSLFERIRRVSPTTLQASSMWQLWLHTPDLCNSSPSLKLNLGIAKRSRL